MNKILNALRRGVALLFAPPSELPPLLPDREAMRAMRRDRQARRREQYSSYAEYLEAKDARRARFFAQGCTDDGQPISDPAYKAWLASQELAA